MPTEALIEPVVSTLRVADGAAVEDATPFALALTPPASVARGRRGEYLFFLFNPTDAATSHLCRELREIATQTYWATAGSVTAALRRATSLTNRYLFEHNLNSEPAQRCYGGLSCAVLRGNDLFLLQAGPAWACVLHEEQLRCFPRGERLAHIGIGPVADVRLHHVLAAPGDTLLLASSGLLRQTREEGLLHVLPRAEVESVRAGLKQLGGGTDFTALIARWAPAPIGQVFEAKASADERHREVPVPAAVQPSKAREEQKRFGRKRATEQQAGRVHPRATEQPSIRESRELAKRPSIDLGAKLMSALRWLGRGLEHAWHGVAAIGAGVAALGKWLFRGAGMTIRRTLPGPERQVYRSARRQAPRENRAVMMAVAVVIPVLVVAVVTVAYLRLAVQSRFRGIIEQAEEQIALAQAAGADSEEGRTHWEQALQQIEIAGALQPDDAFTQALRQQVREALDQLDGIERLTLSQFVDFGSSSAKRRLVVQDHVVFVLDAEDGWTARVPLDGAGGELEDGNDLMLVHTGQEVDGEDVGELVDGTWVGREGGRLSSALLVLQKDGGLVSYDPVWGSESGTPQLTRVELSSPPAGRSVAVGSYGGQFYVLDVSAEDTVQIWRYAPQGDAYPSQPERYFATPPSRGFEEVLDMAIDGHIYVLYADGTVEKFLGGEPREFEIRDVPGGLGQVTAFAVDPDGSGAVYVADPDNRRIVELEPDGYFKTQLRAGETLAALEALAVDEAERKLYILEGGRLHVTSLP